jgi:hypothetical protein
MGAPGGGCGAVLFLIGLIVIIGFLIDLLR